jgi:hypothetical protein
MEVNTESGKKVVMNKASNPRRLINTVIFTLLLSLTVRHRADAAKGGGSGGGGSTTPTITTNPLASQPGAKIFVQREGWYQVSRQNLIDAGWDPGTSPTYLQMWAEGVQQAIMVNTGTNGTFDAVETIEFYATGLDTPSTSSRVYWLVQGSSPGLRIAAASSTRGKTGPTSFNSTIASCSKIFYAPGIPAGSGDGFYGDSVTAMPVNKSLDVADPALSSPINATLTVSLQGAYIWTHTVTVQLNGNTAGTMNFNGEVSQTTSFSVPSSWILSGNNSVTLTATAGGNDVSLINSISLTYPRLFKASGNSLKSTAAGSLNLSIGGFSTSLIRAFDVTIPATPQQLLVTVSAGGGGSYSAMLTTPSSTGNRTVLTIGSDQILSPAGIAANVPSTWSSTTNQANFVIVAYPGMISAASQLATLRQSQGMQVSVVNITDVYDEFNYGEKDPSAIKNFLQYTQTKWAKVPHYVLLLGGASYDPRNYVGYGSYDLVPTKIIATGSLLTASDDWFVDFNNDGLPDMAIGRIPVQTPADAANVIGKITGYGQTTGAWTKNVLMAVDANDQYNDFEAASASVTSLIPSNFNTQSVLTGQIGSSAAHIAILNGFNTGELIVNYSGHGLVQAWSQQNILTVNDPVGLTNAQSLPFVVAMACLNGLFHDPNQTSLASAFLSASNGGAVAVWASSGLTNLGGETLMNQQLYTYLFNGTHPTLGDAVAQAKSATTDLDVRKTWILFGDPTMRLAQ